MSVDRQEIDSSEQKSHQEKIPFPYEINNIDPELKLQFKEDFVGEQTEWIQIGPQKWFLNSEFEEDLESLYNFEFREDDVVLFGYPRSGTTLAQEMLWLLSNDLDYLKASEIPSHQRFPQLEKLKYEMLANMTESVKIALMQAASYPLWKNFPETTERRFIKTHLPFSLMQPNITKVGCKIVYVARNPKDVAISNYHLSRLLAILGYTRDFKTYWKYFENNFRMYAPYWEHIKEGWNRRHDENVLFIFYEDMIKDLKRTIEEVAKFLGKTYTTEEVENLKNYLTFDNFKDNRSVNLKPLRNLRFMRENEEGFIRRGKTGEWKDYFDEELEKQANEWIEENLKDTDIRFPI